MVSRVVVVPVARAAGRQAGSPHGDCVCPGLRRRRGAVRHDPLRLAGSPEPVATLELPAPRELRVVVVDEKGAPVPGVRSPVPGITLLPDCYAMGADAETTGSGVPLRARSLDDEGRFTFCSLHPRYDFRLLALLDPEAAIAAGMRLVPGVAVAPPAFTIRRS